jgi:hypothetical protein
MPPPSLMTAFHLRLKQTPECILLENEPSGSISINDSTLYIPYLNDRFIIRQRMNIDPHTFIQ